MTRELKRELWPHKVTINTTGLKDVGAAEEWLGSQLGAFKGQWNVVYRYNKTDFYFKENSNATMFALKWG